MPSQILHIIFGEDVISGIHRRIVPRVGIIADKALNKLRNTYSTAFALGCQGPDIFYHNRRRRPVGLEYGSLLHRRDAGNFTAGLLRMGLPDHPEDGLDVLGAYALGFMTHAVLDRAAHPYIVYKSVFTGAEACGAESHGVQKHGVEFRHNSLYHIFFERILDVLMIKERRGVEITAWDQNNILVEACEKPPSGLMELLASALVLAFPERAGKDAKLARRIENTFLDCIEFYKYTNPRITDDVIPADMKVEELAYIYPKGLYDNGRNTVDFLNLKKLPWHYPLTGKKEDCRSFPEVYSDAVETAADSISPVIIKYLETEKFPIADAAQVIGNGGLSITDENGKPCAPTLCSPLPLHKVLTEQAELRRKI